MTDDEDPTSNGITASTVRVDGEAAPNTTADHEDLRVSLGTTASTVRFAPVATSEAAPDDGEDAPAVDFSGPAAQRDMWWHVLAHAARRELGLDRSRAAAARALLQKRDADGDGWRAGRQSSRKCLDERRTEVGRFRMV